MRKPIDRTGQKINRWTAIRLCPRPLGKKSKGSWWLFRCDCGKEKILWASSVQSGQSKSCGCLKSELQSLRQIGAKNKMWKGGKHLTPEGYVRVADSKHPRSAANGLVLEHIIVMEHKLGRRLLKGENVHHINGIKDDNRPENLELWVISQPPGQRVCDLMVWANEIIKNYGNFS